MKKLIVLLALMLSLLTLASCGGGETNEPPQSEIPYTALIFDGSISLNELSSAITKENGKTIPVKIYTGASSGTEIVFGSTDRAVTATAKEILDGMIDSQESDSMGYVVYKADDGNIAVVWSHEAYMAEPALAKFIESFVNLGELAKRPHGILASALYGIDEYLDEIAWAKIKADASPEVYEALKKLNSFIDGSAITDWMASLYDPYICVCGKCAEEGKEIACYGGAFYYSTSGRDYSGFLPDIESTAQLLRWLEANGAFENYGGKYANALPESVKEKIIQFAQALQDSSDGYFYHPQWGKNITISRKGRDLNWAKSLLSILGVKPLFKLPTDSAGTSEAVAYLTAPLASSVVMPVDAATDAFEESLKSEATYLEWLYENTKDIKTNSQGAHTVASAWSQIKGAGYARVTYEYYDRIQTEVYEEQKAAYEADPVNNPEPTGTFQRTADYQAVWGLLKINSIFSDTGNDYKYHVEKIKTCIKVILLDPEGLSYAGNDIYNMWESVSLVISNAKKHHPEIVSELYALFDVGTVEMIESSIAKLRKFKKDDGGFSITLKDNVTLMYGAPVAMGVMESDVNGTALACSMYNAVFEALGYNPVPVCDFRDGERFIETILNAQPIEKIMRKSEEPYNFDEMPESHILTTTFDEAEISLSPDPKNPENSVLKYYSTPGETKGDSLYLTSYTASPDARCNYLSFNMFISGESKSVHYQIGLANIKGTRSYMIEILKNNGKLTLAENTSYSGNTRQFIDGVVIPTDEWFNVTVEYYYADERHPTIKVYFNDALVLVSTRYFDSHTEGKAPNNYYDAVIFFALKATNATVYLDDVTVAKIVKEYVEESPDPN